MRDFMNDDWMSYGGAEPFKSGREPQIATIAKDMEMVADGNGITLIGSIASKEFAYTLYSGDVEENIIGYAKEWEEELQGMKKTDIVILMHSLGYKNLI